jgi:hypothetical protein
MRLDTLFDGRCREARMVKPCDEVINGYQCVIVCNGDALGSDIYINTTDAIDIREGLLDTRGASTAHNVRCM